MANFNDRCIEMFLRCEFERMSSDGRGALLDLGCGLRPYQYLYTGRFAECIAADYDIRGPIDVRVDAAELPFADATFDCVLLTEVIEHIPDWDCALGEIGRVLKPGGILLLTWPFNYMMHEIPADHVRLTEFGMSERLKRVGIRVEHLYRRGNALLVLAAIAEFLISGVCERMVRVPFAGQVVGKPLKSMVAALFAAFYRMYLAVTWQRTYGAPTSVGSNLKGAIGHMSLWNLGYCARARKAMQRA